MEIDKGIPIPSGAGRQGGRKYPFADMEIGDSVFFEGSASYGKEHNAARVYGRRTGKKFTARTTRGGVRIWRVE